ncbi:MAG: hypothetical protein EXR62_01965 [Chloroflexi bacterium]|nr:hypothetical protein [Chloroflexota bacterium]
MAKKSRRERRIAGQTGPKTPPLATPVAGGITSAPVSPGRLSAVREMPRRIAPRPQRSAASAQRLQIDFQREHAIVKHDLRRIGLVSGSLVAILVVLSFFIK